MIYQRLICTSLAFAVPCVIFATSSEAAISDASEQSEGLIAELSQEPDGGSDLSKDAGTLVVLREAAEDGDPNAKSLWADNLLLTTKDEASLTTARTLYQDAADNGVPDAYLGLAKVQLKDSAKSGKKQTSSALSRQAARKNLLQASACGSAEADMLLSNLLTQAANNSKKLSQAWDFLNSAGERGDVSACVELADAYLSGNWNELSVQIDETKADELLQSASEKKSAEAALMLSIRLSRHGIDTTAEDYEESVRQLYNALIWAHENGDTQLIEDIGLMYDDGQIYTRTWLRARYLYENAINPKTADASDASTLTVEMKERSGVHLTQKIVGASSFGEVSITVIGFPYDSQYLWDGEVQITDDGQLSVSLDDPYWPSVLKQQNNGNVPLFVKILDGTYAGAVVNVSADWVAGEDRMIALEEGSSSVLAGTTRIALCRWRSLFSIFGQYNDVGLKPGTSGDAADQIILFNTAGQKVLRLFFNSNLMAWANTDTPDEAVADMVLPPWQALFVLRRDEAPLYLTVDGMLSDTPPSLPIIPGLNLVTNLEGKLFQELIPDTFSTGTVRANEIPVYQVCETEGQTSLENASQLPAWWSDLGLSADTQVFMNQPAAFIITGDEQLVPVFIQR